MSIAALQSGRRSFKNLGMEPSRLPDFDKLWDFSNPAGTEAKFRQTLAESYGAPDDYRCELLTQIARCQGLQGRFDAAHATLDAVEPSARSPRVRSRLLLERGRAFNSSGKPDRALPVFREAFANACTAGEWGFAIDAAHMIAIAEPEVADQIAWNLRCLQLIEEHPDQDRWRNAIYNNLGEAYRAAGQFDRALECFQKLIQWQRDTGRTIDRYARVDEAKMLRLTGRPEESLAKMSALQQELGDDADGFVAEERAEALAAMDRADEAGPFFKLAWQKLKNDAWIQRFDPQRFDRLRQLGG